MWWRVENLSKQYRLGVIGGGRLAADLSSWWAKRWGKPGPLLKIGKAHHDNIESSGMKVRLAFPVAA